MAKKDNLLQLIASMTPNEKRNFKMFSKAVPGSKRYIDLFNALDGKANYNTTELCEELGLTTKQLTDDKHYLNRLLLDNLRLNTPLEIGADILYNDFEDARHLTRRGLYVYALEIIEKTIERAWQSEHFDIIYGLLTLKHRCCSNLQLNNQVHEINEEFKRLATLNAEHNEMRWITGLATHYNQKGAAGQTEFEGLMQEHLLKKKPEDFIGVTARANWFEATFKYYFSKKDIEGSYKAALREYNFYKNFNLTSLFNANIYITAITRMINAEVGRRNFDRVIQLADQLSAEIKDSTIKTSKSQSDYFLDYLDIMRLIALYGQEKYDALFALAAKMTYQRKPFFQIQYLYYKTVAYIGLQQPTNAIDTINAILELDKNMLPNYRGVVRQIEILAHYDLGNHISLPHLIESNKVWLKRNNFLNNENKLFLSLMAAVAKSANGARKKALQNLADAVNENKLEFLCNNMHFKKWVDRHMVNGKM